MKNTTPQMPYDIVSQITYRLAGTTTFRQLLKNQQKFLQDIQQKTDFKKIDQNLFLLDVSIQPQNINYRIHKHPEQIKTFVRRMDHEIKMMNAYKRRLGQTGPVITKIHNDFINRPTWTLNQVPQFLQYLTLITNHQFLRKSIRALTFIEHCLPQDKWDLKVYQQVEIFKQPSFFQKLFNSDVEPQVQKYLTITSDGVLKSTKNLLQTKIDKMVPFTNQFKCQYDIAGEDKDLTFSVKSCVHEGVSANFKNDYLQGMNFYSGMQRALQESDLFTPNRFQCFSRVRQNCWTKLYNDGEFYFEDLCNQLNKAKKQVCITDWWMTPYFLLKRPENICNKTNRLDGVLQKLAERGVKVLILLFRQPMSLLCNDSRHCQLYLQSLSRNIKVHRHPITPQFWSHHEKCVIIDQKVGFMGGLDICYGRWDTHQHSIVNKDDKWNGADYTNERLRAFAPGTTKNFTDSPLDREKEPRMPWHDIGVQLRGDSVIDLLRHFIQYWYFVDGQKVADPYQHTKSLSKRYQRAANYEEPDWQDEGSQKKQETFGDKISLCGTRTKLFFTGTQKRHPQILIQVKPGRNAGYHQQQICRSASPWSIGASEHECSIHNAYQKLINQSKHFIYIENQFFMGKENKIVECLANRICQAHLNKENFKVIVVMPLLPGFQGSITDKKNGPLRIQVHNQYDAIKRGENSLHDRLKDLPNFNLDDYIFFFGLRTCDVLDNKPITEIIYVHSKLMIVDDKRCIIGSANINDRSLLGLRDSELAIVVEEDNGQVHDNNTRQKDIFQFRHRIFNEHFGLNKQECGNINSPQIWKKVIDNAKRNTLIYRQLFGCYPDNTITVSDEVEERAQEAKPQRFAQLRPQIFGHAVELPLDFMQDEDLQFQSGQIQGSFPQMFL